MTKEQVIELLNKVKVLKSKAKKCYGYDRKIQRLLEYIKEMWIMEINQYVRYKRNYSDNCDEIAKIVQYYGKNYDGDVYGIDQGYSICDGEIIKKSDNIIDLVKVNDFVNGYKVVEIIEKNRKKEPSTMVYCEYGDRFMGFYNEEIRNVITRAQYRLMSYEVNK